MKLFYLFLWTLDVNSNIYLRGKKILVTEFAKLSEELIINLFHFFFQLAKDLLHPRPEDEKRKHKLKRLVQHPNSYFMDVKCPGCYKITTVFSHAQTVVLCVGCSTVLCQPTGGRARLTEGNY